MTNKKHYEDVWEEAEKVSRENRPEWDDIHDALQSATKRLQSCIGDTEETEEVLGEVLLYLCMISDLSGANSWIALESATNELRQALLDPEENSLLDEDSLEVDSGETSESGHAPSST